MITFVSLFLGLTAGVHRVEIAVGTPVVRVEILLDGQQVAELSASPWITEIDFGVELQPHRLSAVAYGDGGHELYRAHQLVNVPRPRAECSIMLIDEQSEHNDEQSEHSGSPTLASVHCRDYLGHQPERLNVSFDGIELTVRDSEKAELPLYDPLDFHVLVARAFFPGDLEAEAQLAFSGMHGSEVQTQLTAVVVQTKSRKRLKLETLRDAFVVHEKVVQAVAVEKAPAQVLVVEGSKAQEAFLSWRRENDRRIRNSLREADNAFIRFVDPFAVQLRDQQATIELFPISQRFDLRSALLRDMILNVRSPVGEEPPRRFSETALASAGVESEAFSAPSQRLSDALAVAGLYAAARSAPRIVVLVVDREEADFSVQTAENVVEYLKHLRVPLVIWAIDKNKAPVTPWGEAHRIRGRKELAWEAEQLPNILDRQWVVWVEGAHMVHEVNLSRPIKGLKLCGS